MVEKKATNSSVSRIVVVFVLIFAALLIGAGYYLLHPEPSPSPSPTVTPTPQPTPEPFPTSSPGSGPPDIKLEVASIEGFSYTEMGNGHPLAVPVLRQGDSGNITLTLHSQDSLDNVSLDLSVAGENFELEGVDYEFNPSTLELSPGGKAESTLMLEADSDAPNGFYLLLFSIYMEGDFMVGTYLVQVPYILVFPYPPDYIFNIITQEEHGSIPPPPPTSNETSPTPTPTPIPTPEPPEPWEPEIQVERGGEASIIFHIYMYIENPSLTLDLTYQSGALPVWLKSEITQRPLQVIENPNIYKSLLLNLIIDPDAPEGTYEFIAKGGVGQIAYERIFYLKVTDTGGETSK